MDHATPGRRPMGLPPAALRASVDDAARRIAAAGTTMTGLVVVEGDSDRFALEALARRLGRDLEAEGIAIVALGGATNLGHLLGLLQRQGLDIEIAGLCDAREQLLFARQLDLHRLHGVVGPSTMEEHGFFVCRDDLEDELIRALGVEVVEQVIAAQGEQRSLEIFRRQPAQRDRPATRQLRRFLGTRSGRKLHYGRVLVEALDQGQVPRPLEAVLAHTQRWVDHRRP